MAEDTFKFEIYSGRGKELEREVAAVTLPSVDGEIGILPHHCDYVGLLGTGILKFVDAGEKSSRVIVVSEGFSTFSNNTLKVLADNVDVPEDIDRKTYDQKRSELEEALPKLSLDDPQWQMLKHQLERIKSIDRLIQQ